MARYRDEFRSYAVIMLEASGYPEQKGALVRTAKTLKIPHATLSRWFNLKRNPAPPELVQEKRRDLITLIQDEVYAILGELPDARPDADYRALVTSFGILIDKMQLLQGKATVIWQEEIKAQGYDPSEAFERLVNEYADTIRNGKTTDDARGVG